MPAASPLRSLADLVAALRRAPQGISWAGGSAGGTDQLFVALVARAAGVPPAAANYVAFSGGGEALAALLGNQVSAGVAGHSEFAPQVATGALRPLAISSPERLPGVPVPTLVEQGYDVVLSTWRGVAGPANAARAARRGRAPTTTCWIRSRSPRRRVPPRAHTGASAVGARWRDRRSLQSERVGYGPGRALPRRGHRLLDASTTSRWRPPSSA